VYLLRVVVALQERLPSAKMPMVLLPAAEPPELAVDDAVADATTQPEYVYFSRVEVLLPRAKIPIVLLPAA
jgi:hypothetical protein